MPSELYIAARAFAAGAHAAIGQTRKYTGRPYVEHPIAVAEIVLNIGCSEEVAAAALLHDVVEDTAVTPDIVQAAFGLRVRELVEEVTDVSRPEDGNRARRKAMDREHLAKASPEGQTIKLADMIDNSRSIARHDPDFARVYMREKRALLEVLTQGDARLLHHARSIVSAYFESERP